MCLCLHLHKTRQTTESDDAGSVGYVVLPQHLIIETLVLTHRHWQNLEARAVNFGVSSVSRKLPPSNACSNTQQNQFSKVIRPQHLFNYLLLFSLLFPPPPTPLSLKALFLSSLITFSVLYSVPARRSIGDGRARSQTDSTGVSELQVSTESSTDYRETHLLRSARRKKSRCSGERPVCAFCARLGQQCVYEDWRNASFEASTGAGGFPGSSNVSSETIPIGQDFGPKVSRTSICWQGSRCLSPSLACETAVVSSE
jgi:hypothetical protein